MAVAARRRALETAGLVHPNVDAVTATPFRSGRTFFLADDKVQVKYEMLRAHVVDGVQVATAAREHGYSRAAFYLVSAAFAESGMRGLLDERRGRRGPLKLTPEVVAFITAADRTLSSEEVAATLQSDFAVTLHPRTVERVRRR